MTQILERPLGQLHAGIPSVREGHLEPIPVSKTGDELGGERFNRARASTMYDKLSPALR